MSVPCVSGMSQPFSVPSTLQPEIAMPSIAVPDVRTGESIKDIPAWEYKKWNILDFLHTKFGISIATSMITFAVLAYLNPPFIQESADNAIEIGKPSMPAIYAVSFVVFLTMYLLPLVTRDRN